MLINERIVSSVGVVALCLTPGSLFWSRSKGQSVHNKKGGNNFDPYLRFSKNPLHCTPVQAMRETMRGMHYYTYVMDQQELP